MNPGGDEARYLREDQQTYAGKATQASAQPQFDCIEDLQ